MLGVQVIMSENRLSKISFVGDIMCEKPFLKAAEAKHSMSFEGFLEPCRRLFEKSEIVVGNLETPCAPEFPLTKDMFVFNAPRSFVEAVKHSGVGLVTTASNHCLDRGLSGLKRTIEVLDEIGLNHTGTFSDPKQNKYEIIKLKNGSRIAILSYTYGTNYMDNKVMIEHEDYYTINHLTPLFEGRNKAYDGMSYSFRAKLTRMIPRGLRVRLNHLLGRSPNLAFVDRLQEGDLEENTTNEIRRNIRSARENADLVFICPHMGGQFNTTPGTYVKSFIDLFDSEKVDFVIGNHPHVVQSYSVSPSGMNIAYSLGNVSMSLSTPYVVLKELPECSVMLHVYVGEKRIEKVSFSILVERENRGFITVHPLYELYEEANDEERKILAAKNTIIYNRFLGRNVENVPVLEEYTV